MSHHCVDARNEPCAPDHCEVIGCTKKPKVVHILKWGLPLCRFSNDVPRDWPEGHKFVSIMEDRSPVNCEECLAAAPPIETAVEDKKCEDCGLPLSGPPQTMTCSFRHAKKP